MSEKWHSVGVWRQERQNMRSKLCWASQTECKIQHFFQQFPPHFSLSSLTHILSLSLSLLHSHMHICRHTHNCLLFLLSCPLNSVMCDMIENLSLSLCLSFPAFLFLTHSLTHTHTRFLFLIFHIHLNHAVRYLETQPAGSSPSPHVQSATWKHHSLYCGLLNLVFIMWQHILMNGCIIFFCVLSSEALFSVT